MDLTGVFWWSYICPIIHDKLLSMSKFKIGDRVQLTTDIISYGYMGRPFVETAKGTEGTVHHIDGNRVHVRYDDADNRVFRGFSSGEYNFKKV